MTDAKQRAQWEALAVEVDRGEDSSESGGVAVQVPL